MGAPSHEARNDADQLSALAFLADAATHGGAPVRRIDTHGAVVFLAGDRAFKVKRAVRFPFMDYSTLALRRAACGREVAINAPDAPGIYLGVSAITRVADGLALDGPGEAIEYAVRMRRFDEDATLDRVAERGELTADVVAALTEAVQGSHRRAPKHGGVAATAALARYVEQDLVAFEGFPDLFEPARARSLTARSREAYASLRPLLLRRARDGFVRRCHGDLHLRNVALIDGRPTLFDAIEFDDAIATGDVLYDLAFLLMDLWERDLRAEANAVLNLYLARAEPGELDGLAALPLFLSIRAAIRAKVTAAAIGHLAGAKREDAIRDARRYFEHAEAFLLPSPARLVAIGGLSGTGKTTVARALAPAVGCAPGALHLRSDVERKSMAGIADTERLPPERYTAESSEAIYARLREKAARCLAAGHSVVVDAVHARASERLAVEAVARGADARFDGLWLEAPLDVMMGRVAARRGDASDATPDVVERQLGYGAEAGWWTRVKAEGDPDAVAAGARAALDRDATDRAPTSRARAEGSPPLASPDGRAGGKDRP